LVIAVAAGVLAAAENVSVSLITTSPVPFDANVKLAFEDADDIDDIFVKVVPKCTVTVSGSHATVLILSPPAISTVFPDATATTVESSPLKDMLNPPPAT